VEDDSYEQPPEPPRLHGKGPAKEKTRYKPRPRKSHQAPYIQQSRAATRTPPKHKQGVAATFAPKHLLDLFPLSHLTSGTSTLLSTLESPDRSLVLQSTCTGTIPRMLLQ
jgi:hypothetical protein